MGIRRSPWRRRQHLRPAPISSRPSQLRRQVPAAHPASSARGIMPRSAESRRRPPPAAAPAARIGGPERKVAPICHWRDLAAPRRAVPRMLGRKKLRRRVPSWTSSPRQFQPARALHSILNLEVAIATQDTPCGSPLKQQPAGSKVRFVLVPEFFHLFPFLCRQEVTWTKLKRPPRGRATLVVYAKRGVTRIQVKDNMPHPT